MAKLWKDPAENEVDPGVRTGSEVGREERERLQRSLPEDTEINAVVRSDLKLDGSFGEAVVVLHDHGVTVIEDGERAREASKTQLESVLCKDFVGNGVLEAKLSGDRRVELARYSRTYADAFQEFHRLVNEALGVSEEQLEERNEEVDKVSGPKEEPHTYRCPNCGHPLSNPWDACPNCADVKHVMRRLVSYVKPYWPYAVLAQVLALVFAAGNLAPGFLIRFLVDTSLAPPAEAGFSMETRVYNLILIVGVFLGIMLVRFVAQHFQIRLMGFLGERIVYELRRRLYRAFQRLSLSYFDKEHTGRLMSRMLSDTRSVQRFLRMGLQQVVVYTFMVVGIATVLFTQNAQLAAIALIPIPLVVLLGRKFSGKFRSVFRVVRRRYANLSATVNENISGVRVVKSFAQEDREIQGFDEKNEDVYGAILDTIKTRARFSPTIMLLMGIGTLVVWLVGGRQVLAGAITLGVLTQFVSYMNMFRAPIQMLLNLTEMYQEGATAAERIFNIMDTPSEIGEHEDATTLDKIEGRIRFENVSFGYEQGERILKDINLTLEPGQMLGLVGQTGSGKSTLVSLVCRFYDPKKGRITIDGHDLKDIQKQFLRRNIGMVLQDNFLFAGTIRENISYGNPKADEAEIVEAAKAANAHGFIMNLPDGYDSEVGERGVMLSGGEKQRIAIARAVLKDPAILILDEATSSVDTATELQIQDALDRLIKGRTTIAIAHRLSTLRNADRLIVLESGEITESGTHDELMAKGGTYARLVRIQADFAQAVAG